MYDHERCKSRSSVFTNFESTVSVKFASFHFPLRHYRRYPLCNLIKLEQTLATKNQLVINMDDYLS